MASNDDKKRHPIEDLIEVMAKLRDPDGGCPWDLEQNFETIAPYTIEEAYEVADAIARMDMNDLREELGDLILQPIYHAQMAAESGAFDILDVIDGITKKMIERHPHVFAHEDASTPKDVNEIWDRKKSQESRDKGEVSALDGVALALPALLRAEKLQKRAAKVGFEWKSPADAYKKVDEELEELAQSLASGTEKDQEEEFGDVLFALVNFGRMNGLCAETALRNANEKFLRRFKALEINLRKQDKEFSDLTLDQLVQMWKDLKCQTDKS